MRVRWCSVGWPMDLIAMMVCYRTECVCVCLGMNDVMEDQLPMMRDTRTGGRGMVGSSCCKSSGCAIVQ